MVLPFAHLPALGWPGRSSVRQLRELVTLSVRKQVYDMQAPAAEAVRLFVKAASLYKVELVCERM